MAGGGSIRREWRVTSVSLWCVLALAAALLTLTGRASASEHPRQALGLIVKLKGDGLSANSVVRVQASSRPRDSAQNQRSRLWAATRRHGLSYLQQKPTAFAAHVIHSGRPIAYADALAQAAKLRADPDVEWVVVNELLRPASVYVGQPVTLNDPAYGGQVWLQSRDAGAGRAGVADFPAAWGQMVGRPLSPVVVAVLDSGILMPADLQDRLLPGYDFVSDVVYSRDGSGLDSDPSDPGDWVKQEDKDTQPSVFGASSCEVGGSNWHGLTVSYMLAAAAGNMRDGAGMLAPLPGQVLLPVRVAGPCGAATSDIIEGMLWAAGIDYQGAPARNSHPARVINLSFGIDASCQDESPQARLYRQTIAALTVQGALLVASAGNGDANNIGVNGPTMPANCSGVLAVTGLNQRGFKASYANLVDSSLYKAVAVASGDTMLSDGKHYMGDDGILTLTNTGDTTPDSTYTMKSNLAGTSYAAPTAAGVAALMLAVDPSLTVDQLLTALTTKVEPFSSARPSEGVTCSASKRGNCDCTTRTCGAGMLDANRAVAWAIAHAQANPDAQPYSAAEQYVNLTTSSTSNGGKAGGGAMAWSSLLVLTMAVAWRALAALKGLMGGRLKSPCPVAA